MYLKRLEIQGFKTFVDKTEIVFTPGITCIVGPNGSGKSNISDAILWVLGENNVRSLRGQTAQDIIFAGNQHRRPVGMAEVSLTIDNSARVLPLEFSEITVTRRIYRSGESEFQINRVGCRLRDIYELFLDTGVGRDAYSLINQGEIDQILSVRAEDRRAIFEEAAGVKKYRVRRREAERKLDATRQNLVRVHDIVAEIESQLGPLRRQAGAASRYRELAERLTELEHAWYGSRLQRLYREQSRLAELARGLDGEHARLLEELETLRTEEREAEATVRALDARAAELRARETRALERIAAAEGQHARAQERAAEGQRRRRALERELQELESRIAEQVRGAEATQTEEAAARKKVDALRAELRRLMAEADRRDRECELARSNLDLQRRTWLEHERRQAALEARVDALAERRISLADEAERADRGVEDVDTEGSRIREAAEGLRAVIRASEATLVALGKETEGLRAAHRDAERRTAHAARQRDQALRALEAAKARLQALHELSATGEDAAPGVRAVLEAARDGRLAFRPTRLLEALQIPQAWERALAAALGVYADALLCKDAEQALHAGAVARAADAAVILLPGIPDAPEPSPDCLAALVGGEQAGRAWARRILGGDRSTVDPDPWTGGDGPRFNGAGLWVDRHGALGYGVPGGAHAADFLARRREMENLQSALVSLEASRLEAEAAADAAAASLRDAAAALQNAAAREERSRSERAAARRELERREQEAAVAERRAGSARARREEIAHRIEACEAEREQIERELSRVREQATGAQQDEQTVAASQDALASLETARREADGAVTDCRVRLAAQEQRLHALTAAVRRQADAGAFLDRQRSDRLRELRTLEAESRQQELDFSNLASDREEAAREIELSRAQAEEVGRERILLAERAAKRRLDGQDHEVRVREVLERSHRVRLELAAVETEVRRLEEQWVESAVVHRPAAATDAGTPEEPDIATLRAAWEPERAAEVLAGSTNAEEEIARLRRQIRSLGAINPDAPEQYAAARERLEFLTTQRADLEAAREKLEDAIREMDQVGKETFLAAFQRIAGAFDEMFRKLFGGGTTQLVLTDPGDPLEAGIDVIVQPPGKKQQNLLLLSGGERALTAAAMLFALLKIRPSPFCVLDEVDAALDEHNIGRFTELLREFAARTQFVVVTHNRGTMERADTLYGVTMEERGASRVLSVSLEDAVAESRRSQA